MAPFAPHGPVETGVTLLGERGGGFYRKDQLNWFNFEKPFALSVQNPHDPYVDVASNSYKVCVIHIHHVLAVVCK